MPAGAGILGPPAGGGGTYPLLAEPWAPLITWDSFGGGAFPVTAF